MPKTYFLNSNARATAFFDATHELAMDNASNGFPTSTTFSSTTSTLYATGSLGWAWSSPVNEPDATNWPAGDYSITINISSIGANITGIGAIFNRMSDDLTTRIESMGSTAGTVGTGLQTITRNVTSVAGSTASDRFTVVISASTSNTMKDNSVTLSHGTTASFAEGAWSTLPPEPKSASDQDTLAGVDTVNTLTMINFIQGNDVDALTGVDLIVSNTETFTPSVSDVDTLAGVDLATTNTTTNASDTETLIGTDLATSMSNITVSDIDTLAGADTFVTLDEMFDTAASDIDILSGVESSDVDFGKVIEYSDNIVTLTPGGGVITKNASDQDVLAGADTAVSLDKNIEVTDQDILAGVDTVTLFEVLSSAVDTEVLAGVDVATKTEDFTPFLDTDSGSINTTETEFLSVANFQTFDTDVLIGTDASQLMAAGEFNLSDADALTGTETVSSSAILAAADQDILSATDLSAITASRTAIDQETLTGTDAAIIIVSRTATDQDSLTATEIAVVTVSLSVTDQNTLTGTDAALLTSLMEASDIDTLNGIDLMTNLLEEGGGLAVKVYYYKQLGVM